MLQKVLTLFVAQHRRPLDGGVPLLHERDQLLEEVRLLLGVLLTEDGQQVLPDSVSRRILEENEAKIII